MGSNYEAEVEAALAHIKLESSAKRQKEKLEATQALIDFMKTHPDFQRFYNLMEAAKNY